ncbi:MAG: hypothetical protein JST02_13230 [Bacteroidetes bacterium]|nr:hypothetical protein [Bacteroidota bacterium]
MNSILFITKHRKLDTSFMILNIRLRRKINIGECIVLSPELNFSSFLNALKYIKKGSRFYLIVMLNANETDLPFLKRIVNVQNAILYTGEGVEKKHEIPDIIVTTHDEQVINFIRESCTMKDNVTTLHLTHNNPLNLF